MIPKSAIEKAIEGGWILRDGYPAYKVEKLPTAHPSIGYWIRGVNSESPDFCERVDWEEIALDPTFWQALGKALGWETPEDVWGVCPTCSEDMNVMMPRWRVAALQFYDLILTGGDTEKFWADLLAN